MAEPSEQRLDDPRRDGPKLRQCVRDGEPHRPCWIELLAALGRRVMAM